MDDLDDLKDRVERATRVLSEREAEEQSRHSQLVSLMAALEARSLEAREAKERAEARLAGVQAENEELRGLLGSLLDAVETGSRSRFAEAIYALEARVSGSSAAQPAPSASVEGDTAGAESDAAEGDGAAESAAAGPEEPEDELDDFTARLAAGCAVEDELEQEAEALRAEAADDARSLLQRIRGQVDRAAEARALADASGAAGFAGEDDDGPLTAEPSEAEDVLVEAPDEIEAVDETESLDEDDVRDSAAGEDSATQDADPEKAEAAKAEHADPGTAETVSTDADGDAIEWPGRRQAAS